MNPAVASAIVVSVLAWTGAAFSFRNLTARVRRGLTIRDPATKNVYRATAVFVTCGILAALASVFLDYWL